VFFFPHDTFFSSGGKRQDSDFSVSSFLAFLWRKGRDLIAARLDLVPIQMGSGKGDMCDLGKGDTPGACLFLMFLDKLYNMAEAKKRTLGRIPNLTFVWFLPYYSVLLTCPLLLQKPPSLPLSLQHTYIHTTC